MTWSAILLFGSALGVACATPGPTTMALLSRVVAAGPSGVTYFCAGLLIGDLVWLYCALLGFAGIVTAAGSAFAAIRLLGAAYLLYAAWQLWVTDTANTVGDVNIEPQPIKQTIGGASLTLGNPKTMVFYLAFVPILIPLGSVRSSDILTLSGIVVAVYGIVLAGYVLLGKRTRHALQRPRVRAVLNKIGATVIASTALLVGFSPP